VREVIPVVDIQADVTDDFELLGSDALGTGPQFLQTVKLNPGLRLQCLVAFREEPFGCEEVFDRRLEARWFKGGCECLPWTESDARVREHYFLIVAPYGRDNCQPDSLLDNLWSS
jgi:hypothetical protein